MKAMEDFEVTSLFFSFLHVLFWVIERFHSFFFVDGLLCLLGLKHQTCARELGEKMREDPAYILELSRCNPAAKFDQEQLSNMGQMFQRLQDHARQVLVHYYKLDDDDDDPDDNFVFFVSGSSCVFRESRETWSTGGIC